MAIDNAQALAGNSMAGGSFTGTEDERKEKASGPIFGQLKAAQREFDDWDAVCHAIDDIYSRYGTSYERVLEIAGAGNWRDADLDLFWSSFEVLKPAVYAKPPIPAVAPIFKDNRPLYNVTGELLERVSASVLIRSDIDEVMTQVRDDLLFAGRGVPWLRYETSDGEQQVCIEHKDRKDFLHEPARKWSEVGWVAGAAWMTRDEMKERFDLEDDKLDMAKFTKKRDRDSGDNAMAQKAQVWEVWHRANNRVYWVTEGIDTYLDDSEPHLKLRGFFPCPRPAYGTLRRRSLIPVPDWERYAIHFRKISDLTARIYLLLDQVRMKGLIPAGGDVGDAIGQLIASDDDQMLIPVPGAALAGEMANWVQWLPLNEVAQAIQGLIEARAQLISDFYELSGISDIMRGATEADETLGAQRLKSQYGSVRVRCKIDELQRVAADIVKIAAEIVAEKFTKDSLLEMSQMEIPSKKDIEKRLDGLTEAAEEEMKRLGEQAQQQAQQAAMQGQAPDPEQAKAMLQQAQQQIVAKYAPMMQEAEQQVPIEDVMKLLKDDKARSFAFEVESDSTILTDEMAEKQSRNEFVAAFTNASQALMGLAAMGDQGAALAGELMKFQLGPYRVGRQLDDAINAFIDAAPEMAKSMQGDQGEGLAEAQGKLAEAEMAKAQAATMKVEADMQAKQAENQRKLMEMQAKAQQQEQDFSAKIAKMQQDGEMNAMKMQEMMAKIDNIRASTMKLITEAGVAVSDQQLDEFKSLSDIEIRRDEQALKAVKQADDKEAGLRNEAREEMTEQEMPNG